MAIDEEVPHLNAAGGEGVVTHFRYATGQHIHQRRLAHIRSAHQRNLCKALLCHNAVCMLLAYTPCNRLLALENARCALCSYTMQPPYSLSVFTLTLGTETTALGVEDKTGVKTS